MKIFFILPLNFVDNNFDSQKAKIFELSML